MRKINDIIIHCSATKEGVDIDIAEIDKWHKKRGFKKVGYHYFIKIDGTLQVGRQEEEIGAHVQGHNDDSIGICYAGGLDANGKPKDTRTNSQKQTLESLLREIRRRLPKTRIRGHRDFSKDLDKDGVVEKHEWMKSCPSFNANVEYLHL